MTKPTAPCLSRDDRGAIMVIGVFMAIVLVGVLYYMSGLGQMLFRRERMQDAADAVALGTAIGHARGMNLIAFINMVMAALVAVVLALKIIELLLTGLAILLLAISWFVPPAGAAVPIVNQARSTVKDVHDIARDIVDNILIGLHLAERAIRVITPAQSVITAGVKMTEKYGDVATVAVAVPTRLTLPVENDEYDRLCVEAGEILQGLINSVTGGIPFIGKVIDIVAGGLIGAVNNAYCFKNGVQVPPTPIPFDRSLPIDAEPGFACEEDKEKMEVGSQSCLDWEQELRDRHPQRSGDPNEDGNCPTGEDRTQVCKDALTAARFQCGLNNDVENYSWSTQSVKETIRFNVNDWNWESFSYEYQPDLVLNNTTDFEDAMRTFTQAQDEVARENRPNFEQIEQNTPRTGGKPCDNHGQRPEDSLHPEQLWSEWNESVTFVESPDIDNPDVVRPVCSMRAQALKKLNDTLPNGGVIPEKTADLRPPPGFEGEHVLEYATVKHVYGCTQEDTLDVVFPEEWASDTGSGNGEDMSPQKMEEGVALGSEDFQIRGAAISDGELRSAKVDTGLRHLAFERRIENEAWVGLARTSGRIAIAQAEYYFNHNGVDLKEETEWLWHMDWRARLVRFRLPGSDEEETDSNEEADMDVSSLTTGPDVGVDLSLIEVPGGNPSLEMLEQLLTH